jgi:hypothetical protein
MIEEIQNPTVKHQQYGGLSINRMAPFNGGVHIEWSHFGAYVGPEGEFVIQVKGASMYDMMGRHSQFLYSVPFDTRSFDITGLSNGSDYALQVEAYRNHVKVAQSNVRLVRPGVAPGVTVAYLHPEDFTFNESGRSPASPSLMRLRNGRLLASHDIYWARGGQNITHVYYSDDDGGTWHFLSEIKPCFWTKLFSHQGKLFAFGTSTEYGNLHIFRSDDEGATWIGPTLIYPGEGKRNIAGPHRAPMPIVCHLGRIWTAVEYGTWEGAGQHDAGVASIAIDADPMDTNSWVVTPFSKYDPKWPGAIAGGIPEHHEGNVVVTPDGGLVDFLRYHTISGYPDYGKAVIYRINTADPAAALEFDRIADFPGNMSKFAIMRDPENGLYVSLVNRVNTAWVGQRNILSLSVSTDLYNWRIVRDLINYQDNGWPEGYKLVGFQYVDFFIENGDIYYLSRTALNGANNYHDANQITFHKLENYKQYL